MNRIILKAGEEDRIKKGHPWVFDNEVAAIRKVGEKPGEAPLQIQQLQAGEIADVESSRKEYLGRAFVNPNSKIIARIFTGSKDGVDTGFFKRSIRKALERRSSYNLYEESARICFAEADFLPGLIVDRFVGWPLEAVANRTSQVATFESVKQEFGAPQSWLSVQFLSYGMDLRRSEIIEALVETLSYIDRETGESLGSPTGIIERDDAPVRELEGLPLKTEIIFGSYPEGGILIFENGLPFAVDIFGGQKTGHYLDQKENRARAAAYARGKRVLDACCHTGGFGIHAARSGATSVVCLDSSASALQAVQKNAQLNGVADKISTVEGNVFDYLHSVEKAKQRFDLIILDPPAFAKSKSAMDGALRGYKDINFRAINLLEKNGILVTCSCSQAMGEKQFKDMVASAAFDAKKRLYLKDFSYQAKDHPILLGYDESLYLKCAIYEVV